MNQPLASLVLITALFFMAGCSDSSSRPAATPEPAHLLLGDGDEVLFDTTGAGAVSEPLQAAFRALDGGLGKQPTMQEIVVVQPEAGEALVGDAKAPRFLWRDPADTPDTWHVGVRFGSSEDDDLRLLVRGGMPAEAALDPFSSTLHAWTPSPAVWTAMVERAADAPVEVTIVGFAADAPDTPLSSSAVRFSVSRAD